MESPIGIPAVSSGSGDTMIFRMLERYVNFSIELKMAVAREARGRQAGRKLADTAIAWARKRGAKSIVLWTDNRLRAAVGLYGRLGFKHWPGPAIPERSYERMKFAVLMKLDLDERKSIMLNDRRAVSRDRQEQR